MDNKALKTGVYYNENIISDTCEQPIDVDFTLPDYCPDISKIFKCRAVARVVAKGITGKNITIDGNVCITLMYCDKDNNLCSYEYLYPFSKIKEMASECDGANLSVCVKCDYINCRAVSGRKVDIHGAASINIRVWKRHSNQIVSDYDGDNVQLRRLVAPATIPMVYREKYLVIEEEISIGNTAAPIVSVLRYDAVPSVSDCKIMKDKTVVKGDMAITVLYCAEATRMPQVLKATLPFSQIVEMTGITELCKCDITAEIATLEIRPFAHLSGECRSFMVNAKVLLKCESYCVNDVAVIEDAFSTRYETELTKQDVPLKHICANVSESCNIKKNIELNENIKSVVDVWGEVQSKKVHFEGDKLCLNATLLIGMLACDAEDNVFFCEKPIEFEWSRVMDCEGDNLSFNPTIEVASVGFAILNANCVEVRAELCVMGAVYQKNDMSLITELQVLTDKPCAKCKKSGVVVCFAGDNTCVWEVARKYNASIDEIMKLNDLEKDDFGGKNMIMVPIN